MKSKKMSSLLVVAMIGILVIIFQFVNHSGPFSGSESQHQSDNSNLNGKDKVYVKRVVDGDTFVAQKKWRGN
ncbi:thermonuclease [Staphylococcus epidermidis]|nr:thermonuclease [Staphylococcus epidermidis]